jgi:hypothetical protein
MDLFRLQLVVGKPEFSPPNGINNLFSITEILIGRSFGYFSGCLLQ